MNESSSPASAPRVPLFKMKLPIVVVTGKHASGKSIFGMTICPNPAETCHYDFEHSATSYDVPGMARVDVPEIMRKAFPNGYRPIDLWNWWINDVRKRLVPGKFRVLVLDTINELESGLADMVKANPTRFGSTQAQFDKMSSIIWMHVKNHWKQVLTELASRVETVVCCTHMTKEWSDGKQTGKMKPKGLDTLFEVASLYLELRRDVQPSGAINDRPEAIVRKSRLAHMVFDPTLGEWAPQPILPPRMPVCTPTALREFMAKPVDYKKLKKEYLAPEEKASEEEMANVRLATAQAEAEAAQAKLALHDRMAQSRQDQATQALAAAQRSAQAMAEVSSSLAGAVDATLQLSAMRPAPVPHPATPVPVPSIPDVSDVPLPELPSGADATSEETVPDTAAPHPSAPDLPIAPGKLRRSMYDAIQALHQTAIREGMPEDIWKKSVEKRGVSKIEDMTPEMASEFHAALSTRLAKPRGAAPAGASKS